MTSYSISWESGAPWGEQDGDSPEAALAAARIESRQAGECPECCQPGAGPCPLDGSHMELVVG